MVYLENVRIALTYTAPHQAQVFSADIINAYLQAPYLEKYYIICGIDFGLENVGKRALIVRALYDGKTAGCDIWHHLQGCMGFFSFKSKDGDPDVWMCPATQKDGTLVYEYVLLYTDDCIVVSENAESILIEDIGRYFKLKTDSIGPPKLYLGGYLREMTLDTGIKSWYFGSTQYVHAAVKNVED